MKPTFRMLVLRVLRRLLGGEMHKGKGLRVDPLAMDDQYEPRPGLKTHDEELMELLNDAIEQEQNEQEE